MDPTKERLISFYQTMQTIRIFEERISDLYARGEVPGLAHLYIGEEAVATGVCAVLNRDDYITSTHRGHGHVIAKGAELDPMMAELFGKKTGYCKGKGGSMHIADMDAGILGANGIAGGGLPICHRRCMVRPSGVKPIRSRPVFLGMIHPATAPSTRV